MISIAYRWNLLSRPWIVLIALVQTSFVCDAEPAIPLVIGLLLPSDQAEADSLRNGVTLGVEHANEKLRAHASLVIRQRAGQWDADAVEAARMVSDDAALGLIAPPEGAASHLILQVSGRTAVPVISLCPDASVTQTGVRWAIRSVPSTADEAAAIFRELNARTTNTTRDWIAAVPQGRAGREVMRELRQAAVRNGCSLPKLIEAKLAGAEAEVRDQILQTRSKNVLLWLDDKTAGALARALRTAGFSGTLAGPSHLRSSEFADRAGAAAKGFLVASPVLDPESEISLREFETKYRERFGQEPGAAALAGYDAAFLLIDILKKAGSTPAHLKFPLEDSIAGASGRLVFDGNGNRKTALQLVELRPVHLFRQAAAVPPAMSRE